MAVNKLSYTFDDYISNPSGKGSAINTMPVDRQQYEKELMSLESRNSKTTYTVYHTKGRGNKNIYYIHFLIPSSTKGFFNDVVVEFTENGEDSSSIRTIKHYTVKFFSNDMNFVYTYAYTFRTHGVLITELEKDLPFRSVVQKPSMRNPDNAMGYNKSLYFAYLVMIRDGLFEKDTLSRQAKTGNITSIAAKIPNFDKKQQERKSIENESKDKGDKPTIGNKIIKSKNLLGDPLDLKPKVTKVVNAVKSVASAKTTRKVKRK